MKMNFLCQILSEKSCIFDRFFGTFWITNLGIFWVRKLELFLDLIFSFYAEFRREIDTRPFFVGQFLDRNCPQFLGHFLCNFGDFFSDIFWTFFQAFFFKNSDAKNEILTPRLGSNNISPRCNKCSIRNMNNFFLYY